MYVGTLHAARLDVDAVVSVARSLRELSVVLVGPDALPGDARRALGAEPNVHMLGPRPHQVVPAYLQHADVIFVPHLLNPFTESLDPVKAYECLAVGRPTVATPVVGFRELADAVTVVDREALPAAVKSALGEAAAVVPATSVPTWDDRAAVLAGVLMRAGRDRSPTPDA